MKTRLWMGLSLCCILPSLAIAQTDLDGTWRVDLGKTIFPAKPEVFLLQKGIYQCKTCNPLINAKADGDDHELAGSPYYDSINVKVVDDRTIETTRKKGGKSVAISKMTVATDGNTATFEFSDSSNTNADPVIGKGTMTRVAKSKRPPAGSHVVSIRSLEPVS